jgi:hypothetical protein
MPHRIAAGLHRIGPAGRQAWAVAIVGLLALGGCAGQGTTRTGFISSYDGMQATDENSRDLIFVDPGFSGRRYRVVVLEPVAWNPAPDAPQRSPEDIAALQEAFRKALSDALGKAFQVVEPGDEAGAADALRVRAAITNTRKANWWINAPVQVAGIGLAAVGLPGGVPPPNPGGASVEMEVLDGATGRQLVAIATYANGMPWARTGYFMRFGHARRAFRKAAELLRQQLAPELPAT